MNSGIYCIRNNINGKRYIGSTIDFVRRKKQHWTNSMSSPYLQNAIQKYGIDNFSFYVLQRVADYDELLKYEQHWIDKYDFDLHLYNIAPKASSPLGIKRSTKTRELISAIQTHNRAIKQFDIHTGKLIQIYENAPSAARCTGIVKGNIHKCCSGKAKTAKGFTFRWVDEYSPNSLCEETLKYISTNNKKTPVEQIDLDNGNIINVFSSQQEASQHVGLKQSWNIGLVCKGYRKKAGGYGWRYATKSV